MSWVTAKLVILYGFAVIGSHFLQIVGRTEAFLFTYFDFPLIRLDSTKKE